MPETTVPATMPPETTLPETTLPSTRLPEITQPTAPPIKTRIDAAYADLSGAEQRAADFMLDHLADLAVYNAAEVARLSGVSKATVSRLFRRLGFASATEVRDHARALRSQGVPVGPAPDGRDHGLAAHLQAELANLRRWADGLDPERLHAVVDALVGADRVVVVGQRSSYPLALHLRQQLGQVRDQVSLAPQPGQSLAEELAALGRRDVVVVIGFRRRSQGFGALLHALAAHGVPVVLIADGSARRYVELVDHWLECPTDAAGPLDAYATAMSLVTLLATAVLGAQPRRGRERVAAVSGWYDALDELET
jgi:DNA-binding MurR/RpiR family transcriptional regulator